MTAPTHSVFGLFLAAVILSVSAFPLVKDVPGILLVMFGSLLPDIDTRYSFLGKIFRFLSVPIENSWGHRKITHSLFGLFAVSVLSVPLFLFSKVWWMCLFTGYLSHILIDCANKSGVPLFWPSEADCVFPYAERFRIKTGNLHSEGILFIILLVLLMVFMPVSNLGLFRTIRYIAASQKSAYTEYRTASTQTLLEFKGLYADSRHPVAGIAPVLSANPQEFVIWFQGRPVTYGERSQIIPRTSRVRVLNDPLRFQKTGFENQPFADVPAAAGSSLVSGKLGSEIPFECVSASPFIYSKGNELFFNFADSSALAGVRIRKKKDEAFLSRKEEDIELLENEILTLRTQLPENVKTRLHAGLASLVASRNALAARLQTETDPVTRLCIHEEIETLRNDELSLQSRIHSLAIIDPSIPLKLSRALLKLNRMKLDYEKAADDEVLFTGELSFRDL